MKHEVPPFDLSPLPEGFQKAVIKQWCRGRRHGDAVYVLAHAVGVAWRKSTAKQRTEAEPGIQTMLQKVFAGEHDSIVSLALGTLSVNCLDLDMSPLIEGRNIDAFELLRTAWFDGLEAHVNAAVHDEIESQLSAVDL